MLKSKAKRGKWLNVFGYPCCQTFFTCLDRLDVFPYQSATRNTCTQQPLARLTAFSFLKYPRERFENANISILPTFQDTVGSHFKPRLLVVVMATLNQFNSILFVVSVNNGPLARISQYIRIHTYCSLNAIMNSIERGLINLWKWSIGESNKLNLKIVL